MATQTYPRDPDSLDLLKKFVMPDGSAVSSGVIENDPELGLPIATTNADFAGNERLKQLIGLGPSPELQQQRKDLDTQDVAVNQARIAANPEVTAQADRLQAQKLALAEAPNRIAGANELAVQRVKQAPLEELLKNQVAGSPTGMQFTPSVSENGITMHGEAPPKLNQQEQAMVDSAHQISALGMPLMAKYETRYPGIAQDPSKYGSLLSDTLSEKLTKGAYNFGGTTDNSELLQDAAAIQAWGVKALASGRITKPIMEMISAHLPQPGFSPGANYDRLRRLITDVLPAQLQGISEGRGAGALTLPQPPSDPRNDENWQPR